MDTSLDRVVDDLRASSEEVIDRPRDGLLIPWHGGRGDQHDVAGSNANLRVFHRPDPRERGGGLSLAPRDHEDSLILRQAQDIIEWLEKPLRRVEVSEIERHLRFLLHASATATVRPYLPAASNAM